MSYNLFHEHNECVHPKKEIVGTGYVLPSKGFFEQSKKGFYDGFQPKEILAPFNVTSFINNGNYFCLVASITENPSDSVISKFTSCMAYRKAELPSALINACDFVAAAYPEDRQLLQESLLSDYVVQHYVPEDDHRCEVTHSEAIFSVYQSTPSYKETYLSSLNQGEGLRSIRKNVFHYNGVKSFFQNEMGIIYEPGTSGVYIPANINCVIKGGVFTVQVSIFTIYGNIHGTAEFSSLISSNKAYDQAYQYISLVFPEQVDMLQHVLFITSRQAKFPNEKLLSPTPFALSWLNMDMLYPTDLAKDKRDLEGDKISFEQQIVEDVLHNNYKPSPSMLVALQCYQYYHEHNKAPEGFSALDISNLYDIDMASIIFPLEPVYPCCVNYGNDFFELTFESNYSIDFCGKRRLEECTSSDYVAVSFEALLEGKVTKFTYRTPTKSLSNGGIADCLVKAVEKYCEFNALHASEIPFIFGVTMRYFYEAYGNEEIYRGDWFCSGLNSYLKGLN
ncbi:hypothetical protein [Colwellia sp. BRX8-9]|uniref:hypothetical protein n=1 Tax=Colwellia sp. BRX8-9 TaxID=2759831 RepID=UPI0015F5EC48|nr:hypothetical protein [Colwellia sp. BRX8-9]MBA6348327.1 hypothetical protein [Colwellia sp. BRX8-9]